MDSLARCLWANPICWLFVPQLCCNYSLKSFLHRITQAERPAAHLGSIMSTGRPSVLILYGSQTGNAEEVAYQIGIATRCYRSTAMFLYSPLCLFLT